MSESNGGSSKLPDDAVTIMQIGERVLLRLGAVGLAYDTEAKARKERYAKANDRGMWITDPWFGETSLWVPRDALDAEFFANACGFVPHELFGGVIEDYQRRHVPTVVERLKDVLPEIHEELVSMRPELAKRVVDHTGRRAKAVTLSDGLILKDRNGNVFEKRGNELVCTDFRSFLLDVCGVDARNGGATVMIPLSPNDTFVVKSNDWVTEETVFE